MRKSKEGYGVIELEGEHYVDGQEASLLLGVKLSTLYTYVSRGVLKSYKQGIKRQRLYKLRDVKALLQLRPSEDAETLSDLSKQEPSSDDIPYASDWVPNV
jgi:excisionase family DNA binding protein